MTSAAAWTRYLEEKSEWIEALRSRRRLPMVSKMVMQMFGIAASPGGHSWKPFPDDEQLHLATTGYGKERLPFQRFQIQVVVTLALAIIGGEPRGK